MKDDILRVLNLPEKFESLRKYQGKAIEHIIGAENYLMQIAPTGMGKSLIYVCGSLLRGGKTVILTSTKALQDQLMLDFNSCGMVEVRGRGNYRCELAKTTAAYGPCRWGHRCKLKNGGCAYYDAIARAKRSDLVVTNYAFWLCSDTLGSPKTLVLDEAHASFDHLVSHYSVKIVLGNLYSYVSQSLDPLKLTDSQVIRSTLEEELKKESKRILQEGGNLTELGPLSNLCENVRALRDLIKAGHEYVSETSDGTLYVHPITAPSDLLFKQSESIVLTSATVNRGTAELLGIPPMQLVVEEYPSSFPRSARPVYVLPGVKMDMNTPEHDYRVWARTIDQIIRARKQYKGIVHTVSYSRQRKLLELSKTGPFLAPKTREVGRAILEFKRSEEPIILVSPSVTTGYDFPDDECRFQIIAKVPFPDAGSTIQQKRAKIFPSYPFYYAWQQIIQAAGRGVRSEDDWCETFVVDSHFKWLRRKYGRMAQKWFLRAIRNTDLIPRRN